MNAGYTGEYSARVFVEVEAYLPAGYEEGFGLWLVSLTTSFP